MGTALIKLVYKQVIDASSTGNYERNVFYATYDEFVLKSQTYNQQHEFQTFTAMKVNDGRANSLHYKISFAAGYFVGGLKNQIPGLLDNLGNKVPFDVAKFELLESDITDRGKHSVAVNYITNELTLCNIIGDYLVLAHGQIDMSEPTETFMLKLQPNLSIIEFHIQNQSAPNTNLQIHNNN